MANHSCRRQEAYCRVKALADLSKGFNSTIVTILCWFGSHVKCMEGRNNCGCDEHQARCLEVMAPKTKGHGEFITSSTTEVGRCIDTAASPDVHFLLVRWASVRTDGDYFGGGQSGGGKGRIGRKGSPLE
ncbi:hypothetical protein CEXT_257951 [Caerostris extrusa]|uniref:Uncharacterized protein n=1 Tax=Caerostris extrusa TaxID=172846 RepID=A0AAV4VI88_CAEEX|nr:hypothetical protein CEXT_257951 [Caerostris extrusa]